MILLYCSYRNKVMLDVMVSAIVEVYGQHKLGINTTTSKIMVVER